MVNFEDIMDRIHENPGDNRPMADFALENRARYEKWLGDGVPAVIVYRNLAWDFGDFQDEALEAIDYFDDVEDDPADDYLNP